MPEEPLKSPSFVPHTVQARKPTRSEDTLMLISFIVFFISVALAGGIFLYSKLLERTLEEKKVEVAAAEEKLDRSTAEELIRLSRRLELSEELLANHVALTPFFAELEKETLPSIQFTSLELTTTPESTITFTGTAEDYEAIALQSDILGGNPYFKNPVFSNFTTTETGDVTFSVAFDIDPTLTSFDKTL